MLILLAPSEGKSAPVSGPPLDLATLAHADSLTPARERALAALIKLSSGRESTALRSLGLSRAQAPELVRNAVLRESPTAPAAEVYTGVLYQHLALADMSAEARARAGDNVLVASALWGVVGLDDHIPAYRMSMGADIRSLRRGMPAFWRRALAEALPDSEGELVLDLRSGSYAAAWKPKRSTVVQIRAVTPEGNVISHMAKATRGCVARAVLESQTQPHDPAAIAATVAAAGVGEAARLSDPKRVGAPWVLEVVDSV